MNRQSAPPYKSFVHIEMTLRKTLQYKLCTATHRKEIVAALMLIACVVCIALAGQQGNIIWGKVRNASGRNMSQVIVQLETGNGQPINQTVTNNEGDFIFAGLTNTSYIVVISAPDFNGVSEHVEFVRNVTPDNAAAGGVLGCFPARTDCDSCHCPPCLASRKDRVAVRQTNLGTTKDRLYAE